MNWNNSQILGCVQHNSVNIKKFEHLYTNTILRNCTENQGLPSLNYKYMKDKPKRVQKTFGQLNISARKR